LSGQIDNLFRQVVSVTLVCLFAFLVAACAAAPAAFGGPEATAQPPASPAAPTRPPSNRSVPGAVPATGGPLAGPVDTAAEALAAVVTLYPQYAGYGLRETATPRPPSPVAQALGAPDRLVVISRTEDGFTVRFTTGTGDCPSGCTSARVDIFLVDSDGVVTGPFGDDDATAR
jgi:hypothetical protein